MKIDELISALVRDLTPAAPLARPAVRAARWMLAVPLFIGTGLLVWGVRDDVITLRQPPEIQLVVLALATTLSAALAALLLAVPGARAATPAVWVTIATTALWIIVLGTRVAANGGSFEGAMAWPYPACLLKVASMALLPGWALAVMVRRAAPLRVNRTSAFIGLAAGAIGALGAHLACPNGNPAHALVGHVGPMLGLAIVSAVCGRFIVPGRSR